jgi:tetratricopeptide (TPR) repeat protein
LACLGIITPCASGIVLLAGQLKSWQVWLERGTTLLLAAVLFVLTWQQSQMYTNVETLYRTTIARNPACWMAYNNLGNILYEANRIPEAMDLFNQALQIKPDAAHYSLGNALVLTGRTSEAIDQYQQALRINPDYAEVHNNLGNALVLTGRTSEAIDQYEQALRINPNYAEAHNNLGAVLGQIGRISEAIEQVKAALRIKPNFIRAQDTLIKLEGLQETPGAKK